MCYGYTLGLAGLAAALYLAHRAYRIKPKPVQKQDEDEDKDEDDGPARNLRTRPLVPAVDLSAYTYM